MSGMHNDVVTLVTRSQRPKAMPLMYRGEEVREANSPYMQKVLKAHGFKTGKPIKVAYNDKPKKIKVRKK